MGFWEAIIEGLLSIFDISGARYRRRHQLERPEPEPMKHGESYTERQAEIFKGFERDRRNIAGDWRTALGKEEPPDGLG